MVLRKLFHSLSLLVLVNLVLKPVWIFYIDRNVQLLVGQELYGNYYTLLNFCLIFSILLDAGISTYYTANYTLQQSQEQSHHFRSLFRLKIWLSGLYILVVLAFAYWWQFPFSRLLFGLLLLQIINFLLLFVRSYFVTKQWFITDIIFSVTDKLLATLVLGALLIFYPQKITLQNFIEIQIFFSGALLLIGLGAILWKHTTTPSTGFSNMAYLKKAFPFACLILLMSILLRADILLLKIWSKNGAAEVGLYAYGYRIADAFNSFGFLWAGFLFPFLCKHIKTPAINSKAAQWSLLILLLISTIAILAGYFFKNQLLFILYHLQNEQAAMVLFYCICAFPGYSLVLVFSSILTAQLQMKLLISLTLIFILISITVNYFLIPLYGALATSLIAAIIQLAYGITLAVFCYHKKFLQWIPITRQQLF